MHQRVLLCSIICSLISLSLCYVPIKGGRHSIKTNEEHHDEKKHDEVVYPLIVENHDLTPTVVDKDEANHKQSDTDLKSILEDVNKSAVEEHNHKSTTFNDNKQEDIEISQSKKDTSVTHTENHHKKEAHGVQHIFKEMKQSSYHDEKQIVIQNGPVLDHNEHKDRVEDEHKLLLNEDHHKVSISDLIKKNEERKHIEDSLVISKKDNPSIYHVEQHSATDSVTIDDQQKVSRDYHNKHINIDVPLDAQHKDDFGIFKKTDGEFVGIDQTQEKDLHETSFHDHTQHKVDFNVFKQDDHKVKEEGLTHTDNGAKIEKHFLGEKDIIVNTEKNHGRDVVFGGKDTEVKNHDPLPYDCKHQDGTNCDNFEKHDDFVGSTVNKGHHHDDKKMHETSFSIDQHSSEGSEHKHDVMGVHKQMHGFHHEEHDHHHVPLPHKPHDSFGKHYFEHHHSTSEDHHGTHFDDSHKSTSTSEEFDKDVKFEHPHLQPDHHSTSVDHHYDHHLDDSHKDNKFNSHFKPHHHSTSDDHHYDHHLDDTHKDDKFNPHFKPHHHSTSGDHHYDHHLDESHKDDKFNPHFKPHHHSMSGDHHRDHHLDDSHKNDKFNPHFKPHYHSTSDDHHYDHHLDDTHKDDKFNPHFKPHHHSTSGDHHYDHHLDESHKDDKFNPHFKPHHHSTSGDHHRDHHLDDSHKDDKFNPHFKPHHHSTSGDHHHDLHFDDSHKYISSSEECDDKDDKFKHHHFQPHHHHHPHHYHGFHDYHQTKHHVKNGHFHHR